MSDIKASSIKSLYNEMMAALKNNDGQFNWLISKCSDQSKLSQLERKSVGIIPMTLNTFKKYADENIKDGFNEVNRVRKELNIKFSNKPNTNKYKGNITSYKTKLDEADRARAILIRAYNDLNSICLDAIDRSPEYQYDYQRHLQLYGNYFNLNVATNHE